MQYTNSIEPVFKLDSPERAMEVAKILQRFVKEKKLTATIQGKEYPLVEAWSFAGSQLGLYPALIKVEKIERPDEIAYTATVEIRNIVTHQPMTLGVAFCSNREYSKRKFDEYAICSMAQTRAVGKAFRMLISWLMKSAGFEATPAEEMTFVNTEEPTNAEKKLLYNLLETSDLSGAEKTAAWRMIENVSDYDLYQKIQYRLESRQKSIHEIVNPSQADINSHLKKSVK